MRAKIKIQFWRCLENLDLFINFVIFITDIFVDFIKMSIIVLLLLLLF